MSVSFAGAWLVFVVFFMFFKDPAHTSSLSADIDTTNSTQMLDESFDNANTLNRHAGTSLLDMRTKPATTLTATRAHQPVNHENENARKDNMVASRDKVVMGSLIPYHDLSVEERKSFETSKMRPGGSSISNKPNSEAQSGVRVGVGVGETSKAKALTILKNAGVAAAAAAAAVAATPAYSASGVPQQYAVVMPSVKRAGGDALFKQTMESLHASKPAGVPVILVNGNQPPDEHTDLLKWCASHADYTCKVPPPMSEKAIQDAIRLDTRGDTAEFLRWRTMETEHAKFGLQEALKMNAAHIIWLQDDVTVSRKMFDDLPSDDLVCLRDGKDYCGAVAYLFSKTFAQNLIQKIEKQKLTMPIDWIIFDPMPAEAKYHVPKRVPLAHHNGGKKSSKPALKHIKE